MDRHRTRQRVRHEGDSGRREGWRFAPEAWPYSHAKPAPWYDDVHKPGEAGREAGYRGVSEQVEARTGQKKTGSFVQMSRKPPARGWLYNIHPLVEPAPCGWLSTSHSLQRGFRFLVACLPYMVIACQ